MSECAWESKLQTGDRGLRTKCRDLFIFYWFSSSQYILLDRPWPMIDVMCVFNYK